MGLGESGKVTGEFWKGVFPKDKQQPEAGPAGGTGDTWRR